MVKASGKVTIKKYANRRLYDTESSTYITLDRLAQMVREARVRGARCQKRRRHHSPGADPDHRR